MRRAYRDRELKIQLWEESQFRRESRGEVIRDDAERATLRVYIFSEKEEERVFMLPAPLAVSVNYKFSS